MKKGLLITAVLALVLGMALVSCNQETVSETSDLVEVTLSTSEGKGIKSDDASASEVAKYKLIVTYEGDAAKEKPYCPLTSMADSEAGKKRWYKEYTTAEATKSDFEKIESGDSITIGYFSQGTWTFELEAYSKNSTLTDRIYYAKDANNVISTRVSDPITLPLNHESGKTGTIQLSKLTAPATADTKLTIVSTDNNINLESTGTKDGGTISFTSLSPVGDAAAANAIPVGAYTITVSYGSLQKRMGITVVNGSVITISGILDTGEDVETGLKVDGTPYVRDIKVEYKADTKTFTCTATTPSQGTTSYAWSVNGKELVAGADKTSYTIGSVSGDVSDSGRFEFSCSVTSTVNDVVAIDTTSVIIDKAGTSIEVQN